MQLIKIFGEKVKSLELSLTELQIKIKLKQFGISLKNGVKNIPV